MPTPEEIKAAEEAKKSQMREEIEATLEREKDKIRSLEEAAGENLRDQQKVLDGNDLEFDPEAFISYGRISKKDIPVLKPDPKTKFSGLWVDMQSLTSDEETLTKVMLRMGRPEILVGSVEWNDNLVKATVTMALTRMNKRPYPIPVVGAPDYTQTMADKLELFKFVCEVQGFVAGMLRTLYTNLSNADALKTLEGEDVLKK